MNDIPPLVEIAIAPKTSGDRERLAAALAQRAADDPSFRVSIDSQGRMIIGGASEVHLAINIEILRRVHDVDVNVGKPQVCYREKITRPATVSYTHKKQTGTSGEFALVKIIAEPTDPGAGFSFENMSTDGALPQEFVSAIENGLKAARGAGVIAGFPVIGVKVSLVDGRYHDTDSSTLAFEIAAGAALREALHAGCSVLLEPIMKIMVVTVPDYAGSVIGDLNARRAHIQSQEPYRNSSVIDALVPLANMFGYVDALRSLSAGRATFDMQFSHYATVSHDGDEPFPPAIGMRA